MGFGKDGKGVIVKEQTSITLGALSVGAAALVNSGVALDEDLRILKSEFTCVINGLTASEGNGLALYMTQGELDAALVEANIELSGPVSPGDRSGIEVAERWVRKVGMTRGNEVSTEHVLTNESGGPLLHWTPRWTFRRRRTSTEGGWNWAIYNDGASLTTGATARITGTHYGVWVG